MYADYTYYEKIYFGKSIPPDEFPGAMRTASSLVDRVTFGSQARPYDARRGGKWFERMKAEEKEDILRGAEKI